MPDWTGASYVYAALEAAGVEVIVGLPGTQTLPLDRLLASRDSIAYVMARHETAIPHVAWGYYEVAGVPAATLTVPGPGETNAMHGLNNAREDSVPIIHMTGDADPDHFGKKPIHEIDPTTFSPVVKENVILERLADLPAKVTAAIDRGLTPPYGPVRLGVPTTYYDREFEAPAPSIDPDDWHPPTEPAYDEAADLLAGAERPLLYVGGGTARSPTGTEAFRELAAELNAPVVTTYKGKGVFPEDDDRFVGASGGSLPPGGRAALEAADVVLAVGTDFDGICTGNWTLPMGADRIHITVDPAAIDASYPATVGIVDDAGAALSAIQTRLGDREHPPRWDGRAIGRAVREEYDEQLRSTGMLDDGPPLYTPALLRAVREAVPEEAIVVTDVGGFRLWSMQSFPVTAPDRMVTAGSWAGMGVGLPGAIGAKLAAPDTPVVCLTGDGGLLMCIHEMATVAEEDLDIVMVLANNSDYAIISQRFGEDHPGPYPPFGWESPAFGRIAEGFGWSAASVDEARGLERALTRALDRDGPTLVDVEVPAEEPSAAQFADFETTISFD